VFIDCETCSVRGAACGECVVTVMLGVPSGTGSTVPVELDGAERTAIAVLAGSGLVPPLRLSPVASPGRGADGGDHGETPAGRSPLTARRVGQRRRAG